MRAAEYLNDLLRPIAKHPDEILVVETQDPMGVLLSVVVHGEDMGLVVGKGGETANAIRHLVRIVGLRGSARVSVKFSEPQSV